MATTPANVGRAFEAVTDCLSLANSLVTLIDETVCAYADDQYISEMAAEAATTMEQLAARIPEAIKAAEALHMQFSTAFDTPAHAGGRSYASWHEAAINAANTLFVEICEAVDSDGWKKGDVVLSDGAWLDGCRKIREAGRVTPISDDLFTMLRKEAAKVADDGNGESAVPINVVAAPSNGTKRKAGRRKPGELNGAMLNIMQDNAESRGWTLAKWAQELKAWPSQVADLPAWNELDEFRRLQKIQRQKAKRRRVLK